MHVRFMNIYIYEQVYKSFECNIHQVLYTLNIKNIFKVNYLFFNINTTIKNENLYSFTFNFICFN